MRSSLTVLMVVLLMISSVCGCVRRRMTVRTNPPGATVYLDGREIGRTPFSTNFRYYGTREFKIVKQGYETRTKLVAVRSPWYEWVGLDFVSEVLLPGKLTDQKFFEFDLQPQQENLGAEIAARAEELRRNAHADGIPQTGGSATAPQTPSFSPAAGSLPAPTFAPPPQPAPILPY